MSFKRIGDIAAKLIADPVKLQAAANEAPRKGAEAEAPAQLCPEGGSTGSLEGGNSVKPSEEMRRLNTYRAHTHPALRVIDCKGIGRASPTRLPTVALPSPLKLVWNGVQADTTFRAGAL